MTDHSGEQTVAKFLEIFKEFGVPDEICSDRGTSYNSSLFLEFCVVLILNCIFLVLTIIVATQHSILYKL